ncbi:MAG: RNA pyrophosphohydrolase [Holosporales bacterium]|jgi:putative (di)nucleoside polyphosphate hydrolase|nr:RNA pyrophosphohydrolase [Holosporales bacterium]
MYDNLRSGVGMIVVNDEKKIFAGKRSVVNTKMVSWFLKKPWQMPQGGIEEGEEPSNAVMRELKEELGTDKFDIIGESEKWIEYTIPMGLRRRNSSFSGQRQKWFLLKFTGNDSDIDLRTTQHSEFDTWRWMSPGNVIRLAVHFKRSLYIEALKSFKWFFDDE